jgi:triosephosphate isomerase (TIM)
MRVPFVVGNWKMNATVAEAEKLVLEMLDRLDRIEGVDKALCPPFVSLVPLSMLLEGSSIRLGAQNMHFEAKGAYTGEISPLMIGELCEYVILGHSERRWQFGETDELVNKKVKSALANKVKPILCLGERLDENEAGRTEQVISRQVTAAMDGIGPIVPGRTTEQAERISENMVIAYEPVWAIGTGRAASGAQAAATIMFIRRVLAKLWSDEVAQELRILYGGSVSGANIAEFAAYPDIDGALVGGASLKAEEFVRIVDQTATIKASMSTGC